MYHGFWGLYFYILTFALQISDRSMFTNSHIFRKYQGLLQCNGEIFILVLHCACFITRSDRIRPYSSSCLSVSVMYLLLRFRIATYVPQWELQPKSRTLGQNCEKRLTASSYLSVRMEQLGFHWSYCHVILYFSIFRNSVQKFQVSLKYDKNNEYFT